MRRAALVLALSLALPGPAHAAAESLETLPPFEELKGSDWARMGQRQKEFFVYMGIGGLQRQGVSVLRKPVYYVEAMDRVLGLDPDLGGEGLENLFVFCVYESEPGTRPAIDAIRDRDLEAAESASAAAGVRRA